MNIYFHNKKEYICIDGENKFEEFEQGHLLFSLIGLYVGTGESPCLYVEQLEELLLQMLSKSRTFLVLFLKDLEYLYNEDDYQYNKMFKKGYFYSVFRTLKNNHKIETNLINLKDTEENKTKMRMFLQSYLDLIFIFKKAVEKTINITYNKESINKLKEFNNVYKYKKLFDRFSEVDLTKDIEKQIDRLSNANIAKTNLENFKIGSEDFIFLSVLVDDRYIIELLNDHLYGSVDLAIWDYLNTGETKENKVLDEYKIDLNSENVSIVNVFKTNALFKAFNIEFMYFIENNIKSKQCNNCHMYFIPVNIKAEYCNNIFRDTEKPCSEIGRFIARKKKIDEDNLLKIYNRVYAKLNMRHRRNSNVFTKEILDSWVIDAENLIELAKLGKLSPEQFEELIDRY